MKQREFGARPPGGYHTASVDYRVSIDIFDGPLDLLLHLIRKHELDVCDVALVQITDAYVRHVELLRDAAKRGEIAGIDIDVVGDFLVIAATLLEMKSAALLPRPEAVELNGEEAEQVDPKLELVRQLLEYKKIKDSAGRLESMRESHALRFPRIPATRPVNGDNFEAVDLPPLDLEELHVWDLLGIFERLMAEVGTRGPRTHDVSYDDTPIDLHAADIADRVRRDGRASLRDLLEMKQSRGEMVGVFLAVLELVRQKQVLVEIVEPGDDDVPDLLLVDAPEAHKQTFEEQVFSTAAATAGEPDTDTETP